MSHKRQGVPARPHAGRKAATAMGEVVTIAPIGHESGLIAYECPACRYLTSVLWQPNEPGGPE